MESPTGSPLTLAIEYSCSGSPNTNSNGNDSSAASATSAVVKSEPKLDHTGSLVLGKCSEPKRLCLVCGDSSSGFHYGVASCEACKAFFKRTIQGNIEYSCPAQGDCEINKRRRKACQACRFQKCLRMGMLKEGVRLDRVRGGRQKYRRNGDTPYSVGSPNGQSGASSTNNYLNQLNNMRISQPNPLINTLLKFEPEPLLAGDSLNRVDCKLFSSQSSSDMISALSDLMDKELVSTIIWAKHIPGFVELVLNDQMRLLQSTWAEILALSIAFRTQQVYNANPVSGSGSLGSNKNVVVPSKLVFSADFIMEQEDAIECRAEEMFAYCLQLQRRITPLAITKQEFVIMKGLLLFNVDIELEDSESVEKLRNNLLNALQEAVAQGKPPFNALQHLNDLLLCLPLLRQLDFVIRKYWNQVRLDNKAPMNKLFVEMLECNIAFM